MKLKFCGAARCVTGSCHMIEFAGKQFLVDCGMRQGEDTKTQYGEGDFPFNPSEIDTVLLTHAHIDHSGLLPLLVKRGFKGRIITTRATAELAGIMLPDSGHIQEQEAEYTNRKNLRAGKPQIEPLYTAQDAVDSLKAFKAISYNEIIQIAPGMRARFVDVGHLLGSAAIEVWIREDEKTLKIVFSGDIGRDNRPILQDPQPIDGADYLLMEGTYGDRDHEVREAVDKEAELANLLREGMARGGNIVIPSFAVGRTQELLYYIKKLLLRNAVPGLEKVPVYVDSPLGISATQVYERNAADYYDDEAKEIAKHGSPFDFPTLRVTQTSDESRMINFQPGCNIIISSSGMCDAGRIRHHLKHNLYRPDSTVIFAGYQANGTLGRALIDGASKVKLFGEEIKVNAAIRQAEGFSGHAGKSELIEWLRDLGKKPECVFLVHGEEETLENFAGTLKGLGYSVVIPSMLEEYSLAAAEEAKMPELTETSPERPDTFTPRALTDIAKFWKLNGAIDVKKDGRPLFETAYGFSDFDNKQFNSLHTRFAAGEITETFTAALALLLNKEKGMPLRDKLDKYVPEYVNASKYTLADLVFTKKIVPDYIENVVAGRAETKIREEKLSGAEAEKERWHAVTGGISDEEFISIVNAIPVPEEETDEQGVRSNFRLLGMAIERAAKKPLAQLMKEKLFDPLGMNETAFGEQSDAVYSFAAGGKGITLGKPENVGGDAGVIISALDMINWLETLRTGKLLGKAATEKIFAQKNGGKCCGFKERLGWFFANAGYFGSQTNVYVSLNYGVTAVVLANAPSMDGSSTPDQDEAGALSLAQGLRRELDMTYIVSRDTKLVPITEDNFFEAVQLKPAAGQERYVASNAVSIAEAYAARNVARPYVVEEDGVPVGFVMLMVDKKKDRYEIWRFMVDARFQGKGFGTAAMRLALQELKKLGAKKVELSVVPGNTAAERVYKEAGFQFTGKVAFGEAYMELTL